MKGSGLCVVFVVTGSDDLPRIAVAVGTIGGMQLQGLHSGQSVDGCFQLPASKNFKLQRKIAPNSSELVKLSMVLLAEQAIGKFWHHKAICKSAVPVPLILSERIAKRDSWLVTSGIPHITLQMIWQCGTRTRTNGATLQTKNK